MYIGRIYLSIHTNSHYAVYADAGYEEAINAAKRHGIKMPMLK